MSFDRPDSASWPRRYIASWSRVPGTSGYLIASFVVSMIAISALSSVFFTGVGMVILLVGLPPPRAVAHKVTVRAKVATERRAAAGDTDQAVAYAREAQEQAKAALDELRALSRGVAPPLLADRGLVAALGALAEESPLQVRTDLDPALDASTPPEVARAIYFVVAELLTNAAKHSRAGEVEVSAGIQWDEPTRLRVTVTDDGRGGAAFTEGHGLTGLQERLTGLRGTLTVESPPGGPTRVDVVVPLASGARPAPPTSLS